MKKLILILLLISNLSFAYETQEEIDTITQNDVAMLLLRRVYPNCSYTFPDNIFTIGNATTLLEECVIDTDLIEIELNQYKQEQNIALAARILRKEKLDELKTKYHLAKKGFHRLLQLASLPSISNPAAWYRDCKRASNIGIDSCIAFVAILETHLSTYNAWVQAGKDKETKKQAAREFMKTYDCDSFMRITDFDEMVHALCVLRQ